MAKIGTVLPFAMYFFASSLWQYGLALNKYSDPRTLENGFIFYHIIIIIRVITSKRMRWAWHVARMGRGEAYAGFW